MPTLNSHRKSNPEITIMKTNILFGEESYMLRFLTQQMLTGRVIYPKQKVCDAQKYYPIYTQDAVNCIVHALENDQIKGLEYALRGSTGVTFDGILELLSKHCGTTNYTKCSRSYLTGFFEKFLVGRTHDKNMVHIGFNPYR